MVDEKSIVVLAIEDKDVTDVKEERPPSPPPPEPVKEVKPVTEVPDLLVSFHIYCLQCLLLLEKQGFHLHETPTSPV